MKTFSLESEISLLKSEFLLSKSDIFTLFRVKFFSLAKDWSPESLFFEWSIFMFIEF